ncbi:MAG: universal stress protein [Alphaproteobacteria bacterium]
MITTILAPTDGSEHARKAVAFASDLASKYHARLILLHALVHGHLAEALADVDKLRSAGRDDAGLLKTIAGMRIEELMAKLGVRDKGKEAPRPVLQHIARQVIKDAEDTARLKGVTNIKSFVEDGDPAQRILEYADKENVDLIVMGSRGLSDVEGLLVGSTSHKVGHLSRCTVISVK